MICIDDEILARALIDWPRAKAASFPVSQVSLKSDSSSQPDIVNSCVGLKHKPIVPSLALWLRYLLDLAIPALQGNYTLLRSLKKRNNRLW